MEKSCININQIRRKIDQNMNKMKSLPASGGKKYEKCSKMNFSIVKYLKIDFVSK